VLTLNDSSGTWLPGFAGKLDGLPDSLERSSRRRLVLFAMTILSPVFVVVAVVTLWQHTFGLP